MGILVPASSLVFVFSIVSIQLGSPASGDATVVCGSETVKGVSIQLGSPASGDADGNN